MPNLTTTTFPTIINRNIGLMGLVERAIDGKGYIDPDLHHDHFKMEDSCPPEVGLELVPFLEDETGEQAAARLEAEGYTLENIGELAAFFQQHLKEVEKCDCVVVLGKTSRWLRKPDDIKVPCVSVGYRRRRQFLLYSFVDKFDSDCFILVSRKQPVNMLAQSF